MLLRVHSGQRHGRRRPGDAACRPALSPRPLLLDTSAAIATWRRRPRRITSGARRRGTGRRRGLGATRPRPRPAGAARPAHDATHDGGRAALASRLPETGCPGDGPGTAAGRACRPSSSQGRRGLRRSGCGATARASRPSRCSPATVAHRHRPGAGRRPSDSYGDAGCRAPTSSEMTLTRPAEIRAGSACRVSEVGRIRSPCRPCRRRHRASREPSRACPRRRPRW